ncbi:MAG: DNA gyrase subunit A [Clostridia bacterium]|nr:DNA gyrase subunit A [Clostridia bacterium]
MEKEILSLEEKLEKTKIEKTDTVENLKDSFIAYAMAVNVSRAIPDVRDGLKPVHRRILYGMGEINNFYDRHTVKCANIVGTVMGRYHPHGDSSIYDALVRLAQDFSIRYPLVYGQGNFGSIDGDAAAAHRYTEAKLEKIAGLMLEDIDKNTVDMQDNYDGTRQEPKVLPAKIPNLLINGADGIAVGMATNIPPHNLTEVLSGLQALIENPEIDIDELIKIIPAPDYPTGGVIMGRTAVKHAYKTGRGGIVVRGKAEIEEHSNGRSKIVITEIPYQVNKANLIIQMANLVKDKRIEGISDIRDESDRNGICIVIDVKKDYNPQVVLNGLYKNTQLQKSDGIIMLALVDRKPRILNLKEMLYYYLEHQKEVLIRKTQFDLEKAKEREHIVRGLVIALANIDEVIRIIKSADDRSDAMVKLTQNFELDEIQANAILEMKLSKLTSLEVEKLRQELEEIDALIIDLEDILATPARVNKILYDNFEEIKATYGDKRRTEISLEAGGIDIEDLIPVEDVIVSMTHEGYIKRISASEYKAQNRGGVGVTAHKTKEEDYVEQMFATSSHDDLLFFTTRGRVYCIKAYEIPEAQRTAKGRAIINLLMLSPDEKVTTVIPRKKDAEGFLVMATRKGLIKKTNLKEFESIRKVGKVAIHLLDDDQLIGVSMTTGNDDILIASHQGKSIRFNENDVRAMGRDSQGVRSMKLAENDFIIDMAIVKEGSQIITISSNGYGKRSDVEDYRVQTRGGMGVKAGVFNDKTGNLVALKQVCEDEDILLITGEGVIIRTPIEQISHLSRVSQGVKVMRLKDEHFIVGVTLVAKEEEKSEETPAETAETAPVAEESSQATDSTDNNQQTEE